MAIHNKDPILSRVDNAPSYLNTRPSCLLLVLKLIQSYYIIQEPRSSLLICSKSNIIQYIVIEVLL